MNKRITELMAIAQESAGKEYPDAVNLDLTDPNVIVLFDRVHLSYQKFAELLIKECVGICNRAILQNQDTLSKLNTDELAEKMIIHGSINQAQKLGKGIKQHFGVEE
jgi:hypothetical protein